MSIFNRGRAMARQALVLRHGLLLSMLAAGVGGCAAHPVVAPNTAYVRAQAVADPPTAPPVVVRVPVSAPQPGQLKPAPQGAQASSAPATMLAPEQVVADANRRASQAPDPSGYFNSIVQYAFEPGCLYQVYAAPMRITDIVLEPGEKIVGQPASGDVVRWVLAVAKSSRAGLDQWHVYVKPTRPELVTNLAINTDRRSYMLELHSYGETYMASVQWHYPQDELARLQTQAAESAAEAQSSAPIVSLDALNFDYAIQVVSGRPTWTPVQVFDDGRRTFIRFPETMLAREAPALFILRDKQTQLVNYRVRSNFYVVDRLIDSAELRVGQQDQEIVRVLRTPTHHR